MASKKTYYDEPTEPAPVAEVPPSDFTTEQTKGPSDPISPSVPPERAQTIEELGIGAGQPYPTGNPPVTLPKVPMNELPPAEEA